MKCFYIENVWWPFGAHILHVKWAILRAMYNNAKFVYNKNSATVFPSGNVEHYFESWNDVPSPDDETIVIEVAEPHKESHILREYVAPNYNTVEEMHMDILRNRVYRPSEMVREYLSTHSFLNMVRNLPSKYIAMHVRWSDKIQGSGKETQYIPLTVYLDACVDARGKTGINTLVICSDTYEAITELLKLNMESKYTFDIMYDENELRSKNTAQDSVVFRGHHGQLSFQQLESEYMTCFVNIEILLHAAVVIGNYDSCFCLIAVQMRNTPGMDKNVNTKPPIFGINTIM